MAGKASAGVTASFNHEDTKDTKEHEGDRAPRDHRTQAKVAASPQGVRAFHVFRGSQSSFAHAPGQGLA